MTAVDKAGRTTTRVETRVDVAGDLHATAIKMVDYNLPVISDHLGSTAGSSGSGVLEERHKAEVHVELLVTVKQRQPRIISDEIISSS